VGLRRRRNALSPVSRLPPELLVRIFTMCCDMDNLRGLLDEDDTYWITLDWVGVTEVYSAWCASALSQKALWTRLYIGYQANIRSAHIFLARSRGSPLTISLNDIPDIKMMKWL
jgi:hypothetical protein